MQSTEFNRALADVQSEAIRFMLRRRGIQMVAPIFVGDRDLRAVYQASLRDRIQSLTPAPATPTPPVHAPPPIAPAPSPGVSSASAVPRPRELPPVQSTPVDPPPRPLYQRFFGAIRSVFWGN